MPRRKKEQADERIETEALESGVAEPTPERAPRGKRARGAAAEESQKPTIDPAKRNAIDKALGDLTKRFGDGAIMRLGEASHMHVETIPTGSLALDIALGVGGIPRGRV